MNVPVFVLDKKANALALALTLTLILFMLPRLLKVATG